MGEKIKKSKIRKSITRKISTKEYESLDITVDIEEEIEWKKPKERGEKTENISKVLLLDFANTFNAVTKQLGLKKRIGTVKTPSNDNSEKTKKDDSLDFLED